MIGRPWSHWLAASCLVALPMALCAQAPGPLAFRRVFVPQDALDGQIRGLLPLKREEFERRLQAANSLRDTGQHLADVRIDEAVFRARHENGQLTGGTAELQIVMSAERQSILRLAPCSFAIQSARWKGAPDPPLLGVDAEGALCLVVERSGSLLLDWSQRGERLPSGGAAWDLRFPATPRCTLQVETALDERLDSQAGVTSREAGTADRRLWKVELGGRSQTRLTIEPRTTQPANEPLIIVREASSYSVLASAVDLEAVLTLDVLRQSLTQLTLEVDPELQVTAIQLGDQPLEWNRIGGPEDRPARLAVSLPSEVVGLGRSLRIAATAEWPAGQRWALPRVRVASGKLQEGRVTVSAPPWLRLEVQPVAGCLLAGVTPAASGRPLDQFQVQLLAASAAIEIAGDPHASPLRERSGTDIRIDGSLVSGVMLAELSSLGGERFAVDAILPRHWLIDSVETQPAEMLADRTLSPRGPTQQALRLNLARSLNETRPLRLVVRAHFRRPAGEQPLPDDCFRVASFPDAREGRRLAVVRMADPASELVLSGDQQLARLAAADLSAADSRLFETPPVGLLFEADASADSLGARLVPASPRYRAEVLIQAQAERGRIHQTVAIACQPEGAAVHSLLVRLAPRPAGKVAWRLSSEDGRELHADLQIGPAPAAGDEAVYRVALGRARTAPFELRGELSAASDEVNLAFLPEAGSQTGLVEVYAADGSSPAISASEVQPLPATADERFGTLRARYGYDAGRRASIRIAPAAGRSKQPAAWVESLQLTSRFSAAGSADHELALTVVNSGLAELRLHVPARVVSLRPIDGTGPAAPLAHAGSGVALVPLSKGQRRAVVRLQYSSTGQPLAYAWGSCRAPVPRPDVPVLSRQWMVALAPGLATWGSPPRPALADAAPAGWAGWPRYDLELPIGDEAGLVVYRPGVFRAWSIAIAIAAAMVALRMVGRAELLPIAGLIAAAAWMLAAPWAWLAAGAAIGLAAGGLAGLFRPWPAAPGERQPRAPISTIVLAGGQAGGAILLAVLLLTPAPGRAAPADPPAARTWRVVIPVDGQQQPVGDYVFLEPEFHEALHKLSAGSPAALPAWLLESARYELPAAPRNDPLRPAIDELRLLFDIFTLEPAATVALPLRREQLVLAPGRARVDGQPAQLDWSADGRLLRLTAPSPGRHRLELTCAAALRREAGGLVLDLAIPPAARAAAVLPAGSKAEFPAAAADAAGGSRVVELGTLSRLIARWPDAGQSSSAAGSDVEQLFWWRIRPGSVIVEGRFLRAGGGPPPRELVLAVDPRLRLIAGSGGSAVARVAPVEGAANLVRVELSEAAAPETPIKLSWLWPDAGAAGTLVLPSVSAQNVRVRRSWIAATVEPTLTAEPASPLPAPPTPAEFLAAWGDPLAAAPTLVIGSPPQDDLPALRVAPRTAEPHAAQTIDWSLSATAATARLSVQFSGVPVSRWTHRVSLPPQLKVQSAALRQGGRDAAIRWTQQADGSLAVALLEPPATEQTLTVTAEMPIARERPRLPLPALRPQQTTLGAASLRIFRTPDVRISLQDPAGWTRQDDPQVGQHLENLEPLGRLVAVLHSGGAIGDTQPRVNRAPNEPRLSGTLLTRVQEDDGDWWAEARLDLAVAGGLLDQVRLALPAEWSGAIEPAAEHEFVTLPGDARRQLLVRPQQAVSDRLQLTIRGPLQSGPAGMAAPEVTLLDPAQLERLILLDTRSGAEQIDWETTGLQALPQESQSRDALLPPEWQSAGGDVMRVVAPHFTAAARFRPAAVAAPRVLLADCAAQVHTGGTATLVSTFTVEPHGAAETTFEVPPGWRLVQAQLDGALTLARPAGVRSWKIAAPSAQLPYRLTLVTAGRLPLAAPQLADLSVQRTAWTVSGERARSATAEGRSLAASAPADADLLRLETAAAAIENVAALAAADLPAKSLADSCAFWWRSFQAVRSRLPAQPDESSELSRRLRTAEQAATKARLRLLTSGITIQGSEPGEAALVGQQQADAPICFTSEGSASSLTLIPPPAAAAWQPEHTAALLAAASLALYLLMRLAAVRNWLADHATLLLAAAGIAWWLLAPWPYAGWLLVLAAAWLSLRWPFPRHAY